MCSWCQTCGASSAQSAQSVSSTYSLPQKSFWSRLQERVSSFEVSRKPQGLALRVAADSCRMLPFLLKNQIGDLCQKVWTGDRQEGSSKWQLVCMTAGQAEKGVLCWGRSLIWDSIKNLIQNSRGNFSEAKNWNKPSHKWSPVVYANFADWSKI